MVVISLKRSLIPCGGLDKPADVSYCELLVKRLERHGFHAVGTAFVMSQGDCFVKII
jgi:hypothetical protein